jgi:hypothetical protein
LRNKIGEELCDDLEAAIRAEITLATGAVNLLRNIEVTISKITD